MSENAEKPFEATPRRIAKARSEGNLARASELGATLSFAAGGLSVAAIVPAFAAGAAAAVAAAASGDVRPAASGVPLVIAVVPLAAAAAAGAMANVMQNGGLVFVAVTCKLERLNPLQGVARICSRETLAHSLRSSIAFAVAAAAIGPMVAWSAAATLDAAPVAVAAGAWIAAQEIAGAAVAVGLSFAIAEYAASRGAWLRKLRMSFDERRREAKEEEGDPLARGRRRALHRSLLRGGVGRVKDAAFVVTNPAHVAVALEYRPPKVSVPRVLARAADAGARHMRRIAERYRIPVIENVALARALFRDARPGEPIPHVHYVAVAEVVAALLRAAKTA